jgi:two-component system cell cycle response regulator DivK
MGARILIAEDNEANLALVEYLLQTAGHQTLAASDGAQALRLARQQRPDLFICDLQMPLLDGFEVLRQLREDAALRGLPVLALTAFSRSGDRTDVLHAGFDGYLSKPIDPEAFVAQIETHLQPHLRSAGPARAPEA